MTLPSPTALAAPFEYTALKHLVVCIVPSVANIATPTLAELSAGKDVTRHISKNGISGFTKSAQTVQADNLKTGGSASLDDGYTLDASSIQFYLDEKNGATADVRSILAEGDSPVIAFYERGIVTGGTVDLWPVLCQTISKTKQAGQAMMLTASFQTNEPAEDVAIPTA